MCADTAASYCPSRAGELPKQNMTKSHERWDGKLCIARDAQCPLNDRTTGYIGPMAAMVAYDIIIPGFAWLLYKLYHEGKHTNMKSAK